MAKQDVIILHFAHQDCSEYYHLDVYVCAHICTLMWLNAMCFYVFYTHVYEGMVDDMASNYAYYTGSIDFPGLGQCHTSSCAA